MSFRKRFPVEKEGGYTSWVEVDLSASEEDGVDTKARSENIKLYQQCIADATQIITTASMRDYDNNIIAVATALFEKRASHVAYHKEEFAREKLDNK